MKIKFCAVKTILLALLVMALWGSLYPCIKIGYKEFSIDSSNVADILMFAGMRFTVCGIIISVIAACNREKMEKTKGKAIGAILLIGLFSIILHYGFLYVGVSSTDSSKTALIKQLASLLYVCFAFLFFKNEKFSAWKTVGAVIGFLGIVAINFDGGSIRFSAGDLLIISASVCSVVANVISKKILVNNSPFWVTGISQLAGGIALMVAALIMGGNMLSFSLQGLGVFAYICTASMVAYLLWNYILRTSDLSYMFIIKFTEPLFACIVGAILLHEDIFEWQYLLAFILISSGIILGIKNKSF